MKPIVPLQKTLPSTAPTSYNNSTMKNRIHLTQREKIFNQKALAITAKLLNLLDQRIQKTRINIDEPDRDKKLTKLMKEYAKLTRTKKTIVKYNSPSRKLYQITEKN